MRIILVPILLAACLVSDSVTFAEIIEEMPPGTVLKDGTVAGEKEALAFFQTHEPAVFEKLKQMDQEKMRKAYADRFAWFQRVGNFRKKQKCESLQKIQAGIDLPETKIEKCTSNILGSNKK